MLTEKEKKILQKVRKQGKPFIILGIVLILISLVWLVSVYFLFRFGPNEKLNFVEKIIPQTKTELQLQQIIIEDHILFDQVEQLFKALLMFHVFSPAFSLGCVLISMGRLHKQYAVIAEKLQREE